MSLSGCVGRCEKKTPPTTLLTCEISYVERRMGCVCVCVCERMDIVIGGSQLLLSFYFFFLFANVRD